MANTLQVTHLPRSFMWGDQLTRPTTSFARGCKLWSRERQFYEDERQKNMVQFRDRPYLSKQYPEIGKHYPGTWRVVNSAELDDVVYRLTQPTHASVSRAEHIRERTTYVRFIVDREKAKDITYRRPTQSAQPRLEGNVKSSTSENSSANVSYRFRGSRKWDKTAWAHVRVRGTSPLSQSQL
ncbi:hypothetical protein ACOMHN_060303 [Nucella lapillus]